MIPVEVAYVLAAWNAVSLIVVSFIIVCGMNYRR